MVKQIQPLIRFLKNRDTLTDAEVEALEALPFHLKSFQKGQYIVEEGDRPSSSCLMLSGFTGRSFTNREGKRQLTAVHLSGDFVDLHSLLLKQMDHGVLALTPIDVALFAHSDLLQLITVHPHLGRLLWLSTLIDAAIQRAWTLYMGSRTALEQMGCVLCEIYVRLRAQGLAKGESFELPFTQSELSDIMGMSMVHVNRTLQALRKTGLVSWTSHSTVTIPDFERFAHTVGFDPQYLFLEIEPR